MEMNKNLNEVVIRLVCDLHIPELTWEKRGHRYVVARRGTTLFEWEVQDFLKYFHRCGYSAVKEAVARKWQLAFGLTPTGCLR